MRSVFKFNAFVDDENIYENLLKYFIDFDIEWGFTYIRGTLDLFLKLDDE